jgi:hypothetical protein
VRYALSGVAQVPSHRIKTAGIEARGFFGRPLARERLLGDTGSPALPPHAIAPSMGP